MRPLAVHRHRRRSRPALVALALALATLAPRTARPEAFVVDATIYLEFYGRIDVPVWAPAWHTGAALHALQDAFTHMLRTEDLSTVVHVLNYVDALAGDLEEARDGLAHSKS